MRAPRSHCRFTYLTYETCFYISTFGYEMFPSSIVNLYFLLLLLSLIKTRNFVLGLWHISVVVFRLWEYGEFHISGKYFCCVMSKWSKMFMVLVFFIVSFTEMKYVQRNSSGGFEFQMTRQSKSQTRNNLRAISKVFWQLMVRNIYLYIYMLIYNWWSTKLPANFK